MRFEEGGLTRDQNFGGPGKWGDCAFDSFAFALSHFRTSPGHEYHPLINHDMFFNSEGKTIRHLRAQWGHETMSTDNEIALFMFLRETGNLVLCAQIKAELRANGWRTGNGKLIHLAYVAEIWNLQYLRIICLWAQALFFWFPWWNDGAFKKGKWPIGRPSTRTDGYLMWALIAHLAPRWARFPIARETLKQKFTDYYWKEFAALNKLPALVAVDGFAVTTFVVDTHRRMVDL